tara:strand:+ start:16 stop:330 length:315 start_codon:yes stop_codon:yes gene_type:complete
MAIRQIVSRSITDGTIATADLADDSVTADKTAAGAGGVGFFIGENGATRGDPTNGKGDIFRVNESTLNTSVTIPSGDNASCAGPLTVSTSGTVNLTVLGNLTIV